MIDRLVSSKFVKVVLGSVGSGAANYLTNAMEGKDCGVPEPSHNNFRRALTFKGKISCSDLR